VSEPLQGWFIVELMGHRRLAGKVTEQTIAGAGFLRIDVPGQDGNVATQFFLPSSVYSLTPTTEDLARRVADSCRVEPVTEWDLRRPALPPRRAESEADEDTGEVRWR
jgi:hypothetical protein